MGRVEELERSLRKACDALAIWLCEDPSHFNAVECLRRISDLCDDIQKLRMMVLWIFVVLIEHNNDLSFRNN